METYMHTYIHMYIHTHRRRHRHRHRHGHVCECRVNEHACIHVCVCACPFDSFGGDIATETPTRVVGHALPRKSPNTCKTQCVSRATSVKCPLRHSINESWKDPLGPPVVILAYVSFPQALTTSIVSTCEKSSVRTRPKSAFHVWENASRDKNKTSTSVKIDNYAKTSNCQS